MKCDFVLSPNGLFWYMYEREKRRRVNKGAGHLQGIRIGGWDKGVEKGIWGKLKCAHHGNLFLEKYTSMDVY